MVFGVQKPCFCSTKTILLHCKNPLFEIREYTPPETTPFVHYANVWNRTFREAFLSIHCARSINKNNQFWICKILRIAMLTVETHNTISGKFVDAGTINLPLRLLMDCEQGNEHSVENSHSPTKWVANILLYRLFSIVILFVRC